jgi:hypothetical protein
MFGTCPVRLEYSALKVSGFWQLTAHGEVASASRSLPDIRPEIGSSGRRVARCAIFWRADGAEELLWILQTVSIGPSKWLVFIRPLTDWF